MSASEQPRDRIFEMATAQLRFGPGATREVGMDFADMGLRRIGVLTDPKLRSLAPVSTALESLSRERVSFEVFDRVRIEPTDASFREAIDWATAGSFDGYLAIGGGSVIDTAKAANLYATYPAELLDYVNAPIGKALPVPGMLRPLVAVPTTAGTGSETTGVAIFDLVELHAKTGIAHRRLKPTLAIIDPENTSTLPPEVAAATGLDVLCHAVESYTAIHYDERPRPERPLLRPAYQGSNPVSDLWALEALRMVARYLPRVVRDANDDEARSAMLLAAAYAGMGFGNAGVHLPHGMSYPVSGLVKGNRPAGYGVDHALVPHGVSVILNAPAVFRFTAPACPERHLQAAVALGADIGGTALDDAGEVLAERITHFIRELGLPNGLAGLGYTKADIPALVKGTLPQHRVTKLSPRPASQHDLTRLFEEALVAW